MTDAERKKAFEKARSAELKARAALLATTRDDVIKLLNEALDEIKRLLSTFPTEYEQYKLPQLQKQIEQTLKVFGNSSADVLARGATQAWAGGQALATAPLEAAGIRIAASLPALDSRMLMAISTFMTDRIQDVSKQAISKINSQLGLVLVGAQSPGEAVGTITTVLSEESRERAITITRTELGRVHAVAAQKRLEQAAEKVPGLGKQWRRSGKIHSRENHDVIDGQVRAVSAPFDLHTKKDGLPIKMMHPHDPAAPAGEVINCGCVAIPHMKSWKMLNPGRLPFSQLELQHSPKKRDLNDALQPSVKLTEANFNRAQARDTDGKWVKDGGIHATLTGNELGAHGSTKELRKAAEAHAKKYFVGNSYTNLNSGHFIGITWQGMKHSLSGKNNPEVRLSVGLPEMLKKAYYVGAIPPTEKHKKRGIVAMHSYIAHVRMGGEAFKVGIVTHEKSGGHEHYNHAIVTKDA